MEIKVYVPSPGESIQEVVLAKWLVSNGSYVEKDTELAEIESDKATLTLVAEASGYVKFLVNEGEKIPVGSVACIINSNIEDSQPSQNNQNISNSQPHIPDNVHTTPKITPLAKKMLENSGLNVNELSNPNLKRITSEVIKQTINKSTITAETYNSTSRSETIQELSPLRKKLSQRLLQAKNATAMLTTFNEVDMSAIINIRHQYKEHFLQKHGIKLGFMGFFAKAATQALLEFPNVNSRLDDDKLTLYHYVDLGIAVQTEKGLVVPVIRNTHEKSHPTIEKEIFYLAEKARNKKISIAELEGGTFSITNGGVFGSLLATPLLNYPQTAILGMHAIQDRPVVYNGQITIKPMMYIALSYDHRVLDGKDSILFLKRIKELIENPYMMMTNNNIENFLEL
ncbi:MAG: dihydrolipoyllysine-residue succinyltransferase [Bacteroidales bacterium]|nr:dihydrolipoyllysine-residue succinyltransferase [Bacteroidales bacterium]